MPPAHNPHNQMTPHLQGGPRSWPVDHSVVICSNDCKGHPMSKTTSINLGDHFEAFLTAQVESGLYGNKSEVIRAALRDMEERQRREATLEMMRRSMADIDAGRTKPAKRAIRDIADKLGLKLDR